MSPRRVDRRSSFRRLGPLAGLLAVAAALASCGIEMVPGPGATPSVDSVGPSASQPIAAPSPTVTGPSILGSTGAGVPTRVVIAALGIDLPVVVAPSGPDAYPWCNVAMYLPQLHRPGERGATYVFAHARTGMFLPLLEESRVRDGARMLGMRVDVYTSADRRFTYEIVSVHRHVLTLDEAIREQDEALYLQTSEGPHGTPQKLQLKASPVSTAPATAAQARPTPHPVACG